MECVAVVSVPLGLHSEDALKAAPPTELMDDSFDGEGDAGLLRHLDAPHRDTARMLFREFRSTFRRGAVRRANHDKCRRFLRDYHALSGEREADSIAAARLLDCVQPPDNPAADVTIDAFLVGLSDVAVSWSQRQQPSLLALPDAGEGELAAVAACLSGWLGGVARPALEEKIPPRYWEALLRVKQDLVGDERLAVLMRRNHAPLNKLFASGAMGTAGIGRLGRGKALTFQQVAAAQLRAHASAPPRAPPSAASRPLCPSLAWLSWWLRPG